MDQKKARTLAGKTFKARGIKLRKGHWRLPHGDLSWWVDLRADGPRPDAAMRFEIGAWVPSWAERTGLGGEPEAGAVDCPLLYDVALDRDGDVAGQTDAVADLVQRVDSVAALAEAWTSGDLPGAMVDDGLRTELG